MGCAECVGENPTGVVIREFRIYFSKRKNPDV